MREGRALQKSRNGLRKKERGEAMAVVVACANKGAGVAGKGCRYDSMAMTQCPFVHNGEDLPIVVERG